MNVKARIVVLCIDLLKDNQTYVILEEEKYPEIDWDRGDCPLRSLVNNLLELDYNYVAPQLIAADYEEDCLYITYSAVVPHGTLSKKGEWHIFQNMDDSLKEVGLKAVRKI